MNEIVGVSKDTGQGQTMSLAIFEAINKAQGLIAVQVARNEKRITVLEDTMRVNGIQELRLKEVGNKTVIRCLGGKNSKAYSDKSIRAKTFSSIWKAFKRHYGIPRYSELPAKDYQAGMNYLTTWEPDFELRQEISVSNTTK